MTRRIIVVLATAVTALSACNGGSQEPVSQGSTPAISPSLSPSPSVQVTVVDKIPIKGTKYIDVGTLAIDGAGRIFLMNVGTSKVEVYDRSGKLIRSWGGKGSGNGKFKFLEQEKVANIGGLDIDDAGNVYVADSGNHRVQKFDSKGKLLTTWGSRGTGKGKFERPIDVAVGLDGTVYVIDDREVGIQQFTPNGEHIRSFREGLANPGAIDVGPDGSLFVANFGADNVLIYDDAGHLQSTIEKATHSFDEPGDVAVAGDGTVYIPDRSEVQAVDKDGQAKFVLEPAPPDEISQPVAVAVDEKGDVYVSDEELQAILHLRIG